jgi:hypothetical protein
MRGPPYGYAALRRESGSCHRETEEGEAMYIGVGTIVAILVIVLLIAFVF